MCQRLIYFTIGGQPYYAKLLEFAVHTLRTTNDLSQTDIMVMCDASYAPHVQGIHGIDKFLIVPPNNSHIQASMRKVDIFKLPSIAAYEKVLYLDCDIIVTGSLQPLFDAVVDPGKLYVYPENDEFNSHQSLFWGLQDYSQDQLTEFEARGQHVFNCGQFAFKVSPEMQQHFQAVRDMIDAHTGPHFYEQSFMNKYFNSRFLTDEGPLLPYAALPSRPVPGTQLMFHICNAHMTAERKLLLMNRIWTRMVSKSKPEHQSV